MMEHTAYTGASLYTLFMRYCLDQSVR